MVKLKKMYNVLEMFNFNLTSVAVSSLKESDEDDMRVYGY